MFRIFAKQAAAELTRLHLERKLRESGDQLRDLYDEAPIAYVLEDMDSRFIRANRAAQRILGIKPEDVPGIRGLSLVPDRPDAQRAAREQFSLQTRGMETRGVVVELRRKDDGRPVWIEIWARPVPGCKYTRTIPPLTDGVERGILYTVCKSGIRNHSPMAISTIVPTPIPRAGLADLVYDRLVHALMSGQYAGGDELNEVSLASQFEVSRTPVREALRRLVSDGLVTSSPNRQATVVKLSVQNLRDTYEVRQVLEAEAARRAVGNFSAVELSALRKELLAAVPAAGEDWGDRERFFDDELHRQIAAKCGNDCLRREIEKYLTLVRFVRARAGRNPLALAQGHAEHAQILAALESRNARKAGEAMAAHISSALKFVLKDSCWE
jgi:PAS domain S-box-containing protein